LSIRPIGFPASTINITNPAVDPPGKLAGQPLTGANTTAQPAAGSSFKDSLLAAVTQANDLQLQADEMSRALAAGQAAELHQVMLAAEKANLSLQFTLQVRNKVIEAYQEIMRMQV
jgi:flagellar hook-basal body complex protein FliE